MPNKRNGRQAQLRRREVALQARLRDLSETQAKISSMQADLAKCKELQAANTEGNDSFAYAATSERNSIKYALETYWYPAIDRIRREVAVLKQRTNWVEAPES